MSEGLSYSHSEQINEVAGALAKAQAKYKPVTRTRHNPYTDSYYADLQDLVDATVQSLSENGIAVLHFPLRTDRLAGARTTLIHSSGQYFSTEILLPATGKASGGAEKLDAQTIGAAITYAKRYNYQGLVGVVGENDDDGNEIADKNVSKETQKPAKVAAPAVNKEPAKSGAEPRPKERVEPSAPAQPASQEAEKPAEASTDIPKANIPPFSPETPKSSSPQSGQAPVKSQFDTYVTRVRDEVKPELEKVGLKPGKGVTTGAKLKNFIIFHFGSEAKGLSDLAVPQWENFFTQYTELGPEKFLNLMEPKGEENGTSNAVSN